MRALLVYSRCPDTFWSFRHALKLTPRRALNTPLSILTVAALLPAEWDKNIIDMNVTNLYDKDIKWADYVFISAMIIQRKSNREVVDRCHKLGVKVVAGRPLFTIGYEIWGFNDIEHLSLMRER